MAKFKVGDKVIGNKSASEKYGITRYGWVGIVVCNNPADCSCGDDIRVRAVNDVDGTKFSVNSMYFDLAREAKSYNSHKIVITTDGKTTTAVLYDGKKRVKDAKAICSDEDTFDFMTGAKLALDRLSKPEKKPEKKGLNAILYIVDNGGSISQIFRNGAVLMIKDGLIEKTGYPSSGKIMNLEDLKYYFSSTPERGKLKHSDGLGFFFDDGVKYKVLPLDDDE